MVVAERPQPWRRRSCKTGVSVDDWDPKGLAWKPHHPEILASTSEGRAIVLDIPSGEMLQEHQVHEAAWVVLVDGEVAITSDGRAIKAGPGALVHFAPQERHEVKAVTDARLLLLLAPWPGAGHPGAMTVAQKRNVRQRAAERANQNPRG
jgi:quercetin dioxygenase-like cupin family protein